MVNYIGTQLSMPHNQQQQGSITYQGDILIAWPHFLSYYGSTNNTLLLLLLLIHYYYYKQLITYSPLLLSSTYYIQPITSYVSHIYIAYTLTTTTIIQPCLLIASITVSYYILITKLLKHYSYVSYTYYYYLYSSTYYSAPLLSHSTSYTVPSFTHYSFITHTVLY